MSMQEPANHYRLGLKLGTYCDNAPRTILVIVPIFVFVPVFVLVLVFVFVLVLVLVFVLVIVLVLVIQQAATYSIAAVAGN